jgi:hypothetical protein
MNKNQDPEAAETVQTESIKAVDPAAICSAWRPASQAPDPWTRVIAKNEDDDIADAFYLDKPEPGFYCAVGGGKIQKWKHASHYIPWPNAESCRGRDKT